MEAPSPRRASHRHAAARKRAEAGGIRGTKGPRERREAAAADRAREAGGGQGRQAARSSTRRAGRGPAGEVGRRGERAGGIERDRKGGGEGVEGKEIGRFKGEIDRLFEGRRKSGEREEKGFRKREAVRAERKAEQQRGDKTRTSNACLRATMVRARGEDCDAGKETERTCFSALGLTSAA